MAKDKTKNKIQMYLHCKNCLDLKKGKDKAHLAFGWTKKGLQIWCENCDTNVASLDFEGQTISYDHDNK